MATDTLTLDGQLLGDSFRRWQADEEALASEWNESLAALAAYQSHLDAWQQELARERNELRGEQDLLGRQRNELLEERERFAQERAAAQTDDGDDGSEVAAQLAEARQKVAELSQHLLVRTDELRQSDQKRAELVTEQELARAQVKELTSGLEEQRRTIDRERSAWSEEFRHLRELLERRPESAPANNAAVETGQIAASQAPAPVRPAEPAPRRSSSSPVLGSIVEQFGKLRQQRASDRQANKQGR